MRQSTQKSPNNNINSLEAHPDWAVLRYTWKVWTGKYPRKAKLADFLRVMDENRASFSDVWSRLRDCLLIWSEIVKDHPGLDINNPDAVMELFPIPALELRMEREDMEWTDQCKELRRLEILRLHGRLAK